MEKVTKSKLKQIANDLMIDMSDDEYKVLEAEFDLILEKMKVIGNFKNDIDALKPMTLPFHIDGKTLKDDIPKKSLFIDDVLLNAKKSEFNQIKIKKVVK